MKLKKESDGNLKHYPTSIGKKDWGYSIRIYDLVTISNRSIKR